VGSYDVRLICAGNLCAYLFVPSGTDFVPGPGRNRVEVRNEYSRSPSRPLRIARYFLPGSAVTLSINIAPVVCYDGCVAKAA
jgi:hypothetical protein